MAGVYGAPASAVHDHAQAFVPFGDGATAEEVEALFKRLGRIGSGLFELLQKCPSMGKLFGSINNLNMLASMAAVNRASCSRISTLGLDVLVVLEHAGRRGAAVDDGVLDALASCFDEICSLVDGFVKQGWLLRMACNERMKEEFDTLHEAVLEMLKGEALTTMPDGRSLPPANYRDTVRPLRRMLKQMGCGCLTAGVSSLHGSEASLTEVARLLEVPVELLAEEVAQVPESDLDLDTLYHKLMQPTGQLQALLEQQHCSISPEVSSSALGGAAAAAAGSSRAVSPGSVGTPAGLYADLFKWYDRNKSGAIEEDELQAVLADLGMLEGKGAGEAALFTSNHMRVADAAAAAAGAGLGFEAFCKFYDTLVMNKARQQLRFKLGLQAEDDLKATFVSFASFGNREPVEEMDGAHFQKLCRDCGLLGRHLSTTDVDLLFAKVKTKGTRKITFEQCLTALAAISEKKVVAFEDTVAQVLEAGGPIVHATKADSVRLHDDKSLYTGVYARGGPVTVEPQFDLSAYLDRSAGTDARGVKKSATPKSVKKVVVLEGEATPDKAAAASARSSCAGGATPISSSRRASTHGGDPATPSAAAASPAAATPFSEPRPSEARRLSSHGGGRAAAAAPDSPVTPGCLPLSSRRSSGAGAAPVRSSSLKDVLKEAFAGLRSKGKGDKSGSPKPKSSSSSSKADDDVYTTPVKQQATPSRAGALPDSRRLSSMGGADAASLKDVFSAFAGFGIHTPTPTKAAEPVFHTNTSTPTTVRRLSTPGSAAGGKPAGPGMDGFRFVKLCREAGLIDSRFGTTAADLVFAKVKTKGAKKISYEQFNEALAMIAADKGIATADVVAAIEHCGGPAFNTACTPSSAFGTVSTLTVTPDAMRFQDAAAGTLLLAGGNS